VKKTNVLWIILDLIFLVIFNVFFFVLGGVEHNVSVWISYGFIHFSYFMLLLTPLLIRKGKSSAVFGFSLYSISSLYFIIEFITGIIFILVSPDNYTAALLVQIGIAGLYGIILISHIIANEHTADVKEKRQYQVAYVKDASAKLKGLLESISDKDLKKKVERVYDAIYSSPVKSHPNLAQMEYHILESIYELEDAVSNGNKDNIISLANSLLVAVNERNMQLKTHN
jgi:signal transduction histidine kinase